jgi:N-acylglucosamine-6-phosphate 2-epimerase
VRITPTVDDAREIVAAGADILAADATLRIRPDGTATENFIAVLAHTLDVPVLADVDTVDAGLAAAAAGAAAVATTLSGYTDAAAPDPERNASDPDPHASGPGRIASGPDLPLLRALVADLDIPVLAEGRYGSPAHVRAALDTGAHAVVVGTAITDPFTLTRRFAAAARPQETHVRNG